MAHKEVRKIFFRDLIFVFHVSAPLRANGMSHQLFSGRSSGSRIIGCQKAFALLATNLLTGLPIPIIGKVAQSAFVPVYSGGTAPESHGIPYQALRHLKLI